MKYEELPALPVSQDQTLATGCLPSLTEVVGSYGHPEMEVPYTEGFAWRFELGGDRTKCRHNCTDFMQSPPGYHGLTPQDIAAFMRINHGDEPFL